MANREKTLAVRIAALFFTLLLFASCGGVGNEAFHLGGKPRLADPAYQRVPPPLLLSGYTGEETAHREEDGRAAEIDLSRLGEGYVVAASGGAEWAKFQVACGGQEYNYDLYTSGEYEVFPLGMGDGDYIFRVYLQVEDGFFECFLQAEAAVTLESEFVPFTRPNQNVHYTASSGAVALAYQVAAHCQTDAEVVAQVYYWVQTNLAYDQEKADIKDELKGYRPNLEEIIRTGKGFCYDYASLVAALLRINGIPCQLVKGDVLMPDGESIYHAWNMIWLENVGWVAVQMPSRPEEWMMLDLTLASTMGQSIQEFTQSNSYTQLSLH